MPNTSVADAQANQRVHYANCQRLAATCRAAAAAYAAPGGSPLSDRWAAQLTADSRSVVATLQQAFAFLSQPEIAPNYRPEFLQFVQRAALAVDADIAIAVQIGTGGPNPWGATFNDALLSTINYMNMARNPYNFDGYPAV